MEFEGRSVAFGADALDAGGQGEAGDAPVAEVVEPDGQGLGRGVGDGVDGVLALEPGVDEPGGGGQGVAEEDDLGPETAFGVEDGGKGGRGVEAVGGEVGHAVLDELDDGAGEEFADQGGDGHGVGPGRQGLEDLPRAGRGAGELDVAGGVAEFEAVDGDRHAPEQGAGAHGVEGGRKEVEEGDGDADDGVQAVLADVHVVPEGRAAADEQAVGGGALDNRLTPSSALISL